MTEQPGTAAKTDEKKIPKRVKRFAATYRSLAAVGSEPASEYLENLVEFDGQGNVSRESKFFPDGNAEEISSYEYDSGGRMTGHLLEYVPDETSEKKVLERDGEGRITRETKYYGEFAGEHTDYVYNADGLITEVKSFDEEGDFSMREEITYDDKKQIASRSFFDNEGKLNEKRVFAIAADGLSVEEQVFDQAGTLKSNRTTKLNPEKKETDVVEKTGQGKLVSATHSVYDLNGNLIERHFKDFYSKVLKYAYDEQNRCISEELFDDHGTLLRKQIFEYDNEGRLVAEQNYEMDMTRGGRDKHQSLRYEYEYD
jgi:hypothetical protein